MVYVVALFSLMMIGISLYGILSPGGLFRLIHRATDGPFMLIAVGTRVILAAILWLAAPAARHPLVFEVLAIIALAAAFVLLVVGKARLLRMIEWWSAMSVGFQRAWISLGMLFGGYLGWAIWPALA